MSRRPTAAGLARRAAWAGLLFVLLLLGRAAKAQSEPAQQAAELAWQTRQQWAGPSVAAADLRISSAHTEASGLLYAYPQQLQAGIPVYNQVVTLVFKNGKLVHHAGGFLAAKAFAGQSAAPRVPAARAVAMALATLPGRPEVRPATQDSPTGPDQQQRFAPAGVARRPIVARLVWARDKNQQPRLAWNVNVDVLASADWLNIRVDAATGQILGQDNWTVNEKAVHPATSAAATAPRTVAGSAHQPKNVLASPLRTQAVTSASYRVVAFPGERPDVNTPTIDTNPWLRAGAGNNATTYGWHYDGTTDYTITRGNNVAAYDDAASINAPGNYAPSQTTSAPLSFLYQPNFTQAPTVANNRNAAVTNLFYWNNLMHDVMYQYGFTEAASNFQASNLSRGGLGGDYVNAEAQDGGSNNANFATPPDGTSGRMQMYLFNGAIPAYTINVTAPATVAGNYAATESGFSTNNKLATRGPISGQLALYADAGSNPTTYLACGMYGGTTPLTGKIALLYRGSCDFVVKVKNAQLAGAIAAVVINNTSVPPIVMGGTDNTITIPAVMITQADGATLAAQIANGVQVTLPKPITVAGPQLDGDYDSGVMSHEYGHGISNRLTGGGTNTSCLYNAEQAGEGWSDFFALMMTTDWTTAQTTDGAKARPVGTYVQGQSPTAAGIRRYPYTTDMTVNPLTYAYMATSPEVHNIGEIWCTTLWDMTWNIIQMQGTIEANLYNSTSTGGNAVALNLVMQGLKLQPCQPGFLDSRDAILAADSLLYNGRYHCAIWGAFARRGMGFSAREGASTSATDQTVAYDLPGVTLRKHTTPLAGNQFNITLSASCDCQPPAPVSITDQLPTGLQYLSSTGGTLSGNTVTFSGLNFTAGQQRTFQIQAQTATGAGCAIALPVNDDRETNTAGGFTAAVVTAGGGNAWAPTTTRAHSGTTAWAAIDPSASSDVTLTSAAFTPTGFSVLSFYHFFSTESIYDGGMVAISVNNGAWQDAAAYFLQNGYNSVFATGTTSAGKPCFSGISSELSGPAAFQQSVLNLTSFSGQSIRVRFQFQSDNVNDNGPLPGWFIDDIQVQSGCGGLQQVQLLNSANAVTDSYAQPTFLTHCRPSSPASRPPAGRWAAPSPSRARICWASPACWWARCRPCSRW
ncbi:MAG: M36 family metallopeptidase [Janthinobacterium lividum]